MKTKSIKKWAIAAAILIAAALVVYITPNKNADTGSSAEKPVSAEYSTDILTPGLSGTVKENAAGESVFAIPLAELIDQYNSVYQQRHGNDYLNLENSDNWYRFSELSPRFGTEATRYQFTADKTVWPMPTISFYTPEDKSEIFEICMTFDDHGYQERFHELFKELCICMEKTVISEMTEREAEELFEKLYSEACDNFFGNHAAYGDPERPPLTVIHCCDKIGLYCFYGAGNIEICFLPLTENAVNILKVENTAFDDFKETVKNETE